MRRLAVVLVTTLLAGVVAVVGVAPAQAASAWPLTQQGQPRNNNAMALQYLLTAHGYPTTAAPALGPGRSW